MKEEILKLQKEHKQLMERVVTIENAIKAFQLVCEHKENGKDTMVYIGHDSHKNYYKCSICGYESWD